MPGSPALLNDVLSVPPTLRLVVADGADRRRDPANGASAWRTTAAADGGPNTPAPRARPVPESMLRYASSLRVFRLLALERSEVLLHVRLRAEHALLLAAPQRDANGPPRRDADRLQNPRRLHHRRAANRVVGRAGRRVPRVEVAAEHHDFVLLVGAGNLRDRVVGGPPFRIHRVDDVELELDRRAVGEDARDAAVVFVAQHDRRHRLREIVGAVVERDDLAVLARRRR